MTETASGQLPVSTALSEAQPESISEVTVLNPEGWTEGQLERLVEMLRAGAERRAKGLAEDKARPGRKTAAGPKTSMTIDDLGL